MFRSKIVKDAEFQRNGAVSWIAVYLPDVECHISISSSLVSHSAKALSERELEETIEILSRKAKVMTKQRNFPSIYDEMLTELKDTLEERKAEEIVKVIDYNALLALCTRYDNKTGEYPEHEHEGAAVLAFFERLQHNVANPKAKVRER